MDAPPDHRRLARLLQVDELRWLTLLGALAWPGPSMLDRLASEHLVGRRLTPLRKVRSATLQPDSWCRDGHETLQCVQLHPETCCMVLGVEIGRRDHASVLVGLDGRLLPRDRGAIHTALVGHPVWELVADARPLADAVLGHGLGPVALWAESLARARVAAMLQHRRVLESMPMLVGLFEALDAYRGLGGTLAALAADWTGSPSSLLDTVESFGVDLSPTPAAP